MDEPEHTGPLPSLGGEADAGSWDLSDSSGPLPNPVGHTFPILKHDLQGVWTLVGTGFYVSRDGLFITAKHVIEDVLVGAEQTAPIAILHLHSSTGGMFGPDEHIIRPIEVCWLGEDADIAFGAAVGMKNNTTGEQLTQRCWQLDWKAPDVGAPAGTYAFPNHSVESLADGRQLFHFRPDFYRGRIDEVGDFRDRVRMPFPFVRTDFRIHGAASGGPIIVDGKVVAINTSEYVEGLAYGTQIRCLSQAFLQSSVAGVPDAPVSFRRLVEVGFIPVTSWHASDDVSQPGRVVSLLQIPPTAPPPGLVFDMLA